MVIQLYLIVFVIFVHIKHGYTLTFLIFTNFSFFDALNE